MSQSVSPRAITCLPPADAADPDAAVAVSEPAAGVVSAVPDAASPVVAAPSVDFAAVSFVSVAVSAVAGAAALTSVMRPPVAGL